MKPIAAAVAGALISGVAMYTVGARTTSVDAFTSPAVVQTLDGQYVEIPNAQPARANSLVRPVATTTVRRAPVATRTVARRTVAAAPAQERVVYEERAPQRSWGKTALIIGGSTASGAGVGAIIGGKKGALAGAAIGGGAASIYEATRRR